MAAGWLAIVASSERVFTLLTGRQRRHIIAIAGCSIRRSASNTIRISFIGLVTTADR